ncbi:MAG: Na(+)-translocating NADH-quinone reductase subunit C [Xanthomonadales bacterium]
MDNESPLKAIIVVTATALVCSVLVTVAAVTLRPIQWAHQDLERNRHIVRISGLMDPADELSDWEIIAAFQDLDARLVDLDRGAFDETFNPDTFDTRKAAGDPEFSVTIPADQDVAGLKRRSRLMTVYLVRDGDDLHRIILPVYGPGMWSTIYGFLALESDLNTIAEMSFYEQEETAGIGDQILRPDWLARWRGKRLYDEQGVVRFRIAGGSVDPRSPDAAYQVDALTGASVTAGGVTNLIRYWLGPHGFANFLEKFSVAGG